MKKFLFSLMMVALIAFSCSEKDSKATLSLSETGTIEVSNEATTKSIAVTTNQKNWKAQPGAEWIKVSQNGNTLNLNILENTTPDARKADVLVIAGSANATITINQAGAKLFLEINPNKLEVNDSEGSYTLEVKTNAADWTAECSSPWVTVTALKDKKEIKVDIKENKNEGSREASIVVKDVAGNISVACPIKQTFAPLYILPLISVDATPTEVDEFETKRNSVKQESKDPIVAEYIPNCKSFKLVQYVFNENNKGFQQIALLANSYRNLDDNFISFLKKDGFVANGLFNGMFEQYDKEINKDGKVHVVSAIIVKIDGSPDDVENGVIFSFKQKQTEPIETFKDLPLGCLDFSATEDVVKDWESKNNGTYDSSIDTGTSNALVFNIDDNENKVVKRLYFINKDSKILVEGVVWVADPTKVFFDSVTLTTDFEKLLKDKGYEFVRADNTQGGKTFIYKNDKLAVTFTYAQGGFKGIYEKTVVDIRYFDVAILSSSASNLAVSSKDNSLLKYVPKSNKPSIIKSTF